jgi:hypothetical protein
VSVFGSDVFLEGGMQVEVCYGMDLGEATQRFGVVLYI